MGYVQGKCKTLPLRERVEVREDIWGNKKIEMSESEGGGEQIVWLFLHVWSVCVHMCVCMCMHVEAGVQCLDLQPLSSFFFLYFLRQEFHGSWCHWFGKISFPASPRVPPVSASPVLRLQEQAGILYFLCESGNPCSSLMLPWQTLYNEPSFNPPIWLLL